MKTKDAGGQPETPTSDGKSPKTAPRPSAALRSLSLLQELELDEFQARYGFWGYLFLCLIGNAAISVPAILLWSSMGFGEQMFEFLQEYASYKLLPFGVSVVIVTFMYMMDMFLPAHTMHFNQGCLHSKLAWILLAIAIVFFVWSCLLLQSTYPSVPLLINISLIPLSAVVVRHLSAPTEASESQTARVIEEGSVEAKMRLLKRIAGSEEDGKNFYRGAFAAFMIVFVASGGLWAIWAASLTDGIDALMKGLNSSQRDEVWILWITPMIVSFSNFVFGLFITLRLFMQRTYSGTDKHRNRLIAETVSSQMSKDFMAVRANLVEAQVVDVLRDNAEAKEELKALEARYLEEDARCLKALSLLVKLVVCVFIVLIGCFYVAAQLLYADSEIATLVLGLLGAFFLNFVIFTYLAFRRIIRAMGKWLFDLPLWKACKALAQNNWARAFIFCPLMPVVPIFLVMSLANQWIRKKRRVYDTIDDPLEEDGGRTSGTQSVSVAIPHPETLTLTPRVHSAVMLIRSWDWLSITFRVYVLCLVFFCYIVTPALLNVLLAWMRDALASWPFGVIVATTFVLGVVAFLCPFVPGMTVYIFGGLVISNTCPPVGTDQGFWIGSWINVLMCWFLKLTACAVEQKCIGEWLGSSIWVRQQAGVHKVAIRCIESILAKPGWTVGKVAILCGGPDWPTSVMAGVLKLSLIQCEIGTIPIIGFVIPCALSGSLYLKKDEEDPIWSRSANLMIIVAVAVNMLLWAVAAWAIQNELEKHYRDLTRKLEKNIQLEWLDYREGEVSKKVVVTWFDVPAMVKFFYLFGATVHILVCHAMWWGYSYLIGDFKVSDSINKLSWYSGTLYHSSDDDSTSDKIDLFSMSAIVIIIVYFATCLCLYGYNRWYAKATRQTRREAYLALDGSEEKWKEQWLADMRQAEEEEKRNANMSEKAAADSGIVFELTSRSTSKLHEAAVAGSDAHHAQHIKASHVPPTVEYGAATHAYDFVIAPGQSDDQLLTVSAGLHSAQV